ncbi:MAG: FtsX-like permease family protein [Balneolaceae bacterium]|nr:FtsX-like permease family protein [Balneolaceae bacterium]
MLTLKLAWRNIWRNRRRTIITTLSIIVAVFLSAVTRSTQEGQYENMIKNTVGTFTGYIQIHHQGYWEEPTLENSMGTVDSLLAQLSGHRGVTELVPRIESYALAAGRDLSRPAMILGIDIEAEKALSNPRDRLTSGRYFNSNNEQAAILGTELMDRMNIELGDSLVLVGQGFHGMTASGLYPVKGTVSYINPELNSNLVLLPLQTAQQFLLTGDRLTTIALMIENPALIDRTVEELRAVLPEETYEVMGWREMMPELVQAIQADRGSGIIILLVLYMVVGFGILGTVLMMIAEREFELGVMISVGTSRWMIAKILSLEVLLMTLLGTALGILFSMPVIWYFKLNPIRFTGDMSTVAQQYGMDPVLQFSADSAIFTGQAVTVFIITLLFSAIPLWRAARLNPVKAMRG